MCRYSRICEHTVKVNLGNVAFSHSLSLSLLLSFSFSLNKFDAKKNREFDVCCICSLDYLFVMLQFLYAYVSVALNKNFNSKSKSMLFVRRIYVHLFLIYWKTFAKSYIIQVLCYMVWTSRDRLDKEANTINQRILTEMYWKYVHFRFDVLLEFLLTFVHPYSQLVLSMKAFDDFEFSSTKYALDLFGVNRTLMRTISICIANGFSSLKCYNEYDEKWIDET